MRRDPEIIPQTRNALMALRGRGPIIVGPWLGEIGFELLYWIPFLRWACGFARLQPDDLWIVSRGGCRSWYAGIGAQYVDVFDLCTPDQFRHGNARRMAEQGANFKALGLRHGRASTKQHMSTSFDRAILKHVAQATGVSTANVLHPSLMYALFRPFWRRQQPDLYRLMTKPTRVSPPPIVEGLPASYIAAKFYASEACPAAPLNTKMVNEIVRAVAASTDVVLLHSGTRYDDHGEFSVASHPRVHRVPMDPATNLHTQTAVIAGAKGYVGTYGGFAYLAPFLGVKTRTFYARPNFRKDHRELMGRVCMTALKTSFSVEPLSGGAVTMIRRAGRHAA